MARAQASLNALPVCSTAPRVPLRIASLRGRHSGSIEGVLLRCEASRAGLDRLAHGPCPGALYRGLRRRGLHRRRRSSSLDEAWCATGRPARRRSSCTSRASACGHRSPAAPSAFGGPQVKHRHRWDRLATKPTSCSDVLHCRRLGGGHAARAVNERCRAERLDEAPSVCRRALKPYHHPPPLSPLPPPPPPPPLPSLPPPPPQPQSRRDAVGHCDANDAEPRGRRCAGAPVVRRSAKALSRGTRAGAAPRGTP